MANNKQVRIAEPDKSPATVSEGPSVETLAFKLPGRSRFLSARALRDNPRFLIGGGIILLMILLALLAPVLPLPDPETGIATRAYQPPGANNFLGTDNVGRDVFSRV